MMDPIYFDKARAQRWVDRSSPVTTVADHDSLVAYCSSLSDVLARPDLVAQKVNDPSIPIADRKLTFPQAIYHGDLPEADGREVDIVGSLSPLPADMELIPTTEFPIKPRILYWRTLQEAFRQLSLNVYSPAGSTPTGELEALAKPGVQLVAGPLRAALIPYLPPETNILEPDAAGEIQTFLTFLVPIVRAIVVASWEGSDVDTATRTKAAQLQADNATSAAFSREMADIATLQVNWSDHHKSAMQWLIGTGITVAAASALLTIFGTPAQTGWLQKWMFFGKQAIRRARGKKLQKTRRRT